LTYYTLETKWISEASKAEEFSVYIYLTKNSNERKNLHVSFKHYAELQSRLNIHNWPSVTD